MNPQDILKALSRDQLKSLSKSELVDLLLGEQSIRKQLEEQRDQAQEEKLLIEEKYVLIKSKVFGRSSEKSPPSKEKHPKKEKKARKDFSKDLSSRYPNLDIREDEISLETPPTCQCCQGTMEESAMTEDSEYLTVIPKKFLIVRQKRHKYRCGKCHGDVQTAPGIPRIAPGSSYGDDVIQDVSLSKYCDLIPIERYAMIAARQGARGLPPNSLIGLTHFMAEFVRGAYVKILLEIRASRVVQADETTHRMLEGALKENWYLWGFSSARGCYFEFHDTRSGDVAHEFLKDSKCRILLSDVFSGYARAVRESNKFREGIGREPIVSAYCNAHARRKFDEAKSPFEKEAEFYLEQYKAIYKLESECRGESSKIILEKRSEMKAIFEGMKKKAGEDLLGVSNKSSLAMAIKYFTNNFEGLTLFLTNADVPIDNNSQERLLRNPVIGRKTWYGTHSIKGARTAAVIFSLVESCKLNGVNPREYFRELTHALHQQKEAFTPWEYLQKTSTN